MHIRQVAVASLLVCGGLAAPAAMAAPAVPSVKARPAVIAVIGDSGFNPLHEEFATADGRDPVYPPGMPAVVRVSVPRSGTFQERLAVLRAGPLGTPKPGTLYALAGTRLLVYAPADANAESALADRAHGTGVVASAAGGRTGTSKNALVVFVQGASDDGYNWLSRQAWIDVATTSVYNIRTTDQCVGAAGARALYGAGGLLFSSSGNTLDAFEPLAMPNGLPDVYQVGGVDASGRTWLPPRPEEDSPFLAAGNVIRPYESGARFSYPAPSGDALTGNQPFGGTSGATPTVAGYAAELVAAARRVLGSDQVRTADALAVAKPGRRVPNAGPLSDGRFTRDELVELLHATARPAETAGPHRYAVEGFGATDDRSHRLALAVLAGIAPAPDRTQEQGAHAQAERTRAAATARC